MIELYLFIHPLNKTSYQIEKKILELIQVNSQTINLQILPLVNLATNQAMLAKQQPRWCHIEPHFFHYAHEIALDFKAAQLQGKRYARHLLLQIQEALFFQGLPYTSELVTNLFAQSGGDVAGFQEDRQSQLVKDLFWQDQQVAREFKVTQPNTLIAYDFNQEEAGCLLTENELLPNLHALNDYLFNHQLTHLALYRSETS